LRASAEAKTALRIRERHSCDRYALGVRLGVSRCTMVRAGSPIGLRPLARARGGQKKRTRRLGRDLSPPLGKSRQGEEDGLHGKPCSRQTYNGISKPTSPRRGRPACRTRSSPRRAPPRSETVHRPPSCRCRPRGAPSGVGRVLNGFEEERKDVLQDLRRPVFGHRYAEALEEASGIFDLGLYEAHCRRNELKPGCSNRIHDRSVQSALPISRVLRPTVGYPSSDSSERRSALCRWIARSKPTMRRSR